MLPKLPFSYRKRKFRKFALCVSTPNISECVVRKRPFRTLKEPISHPERAHFARQYAADRIMVRAQTPYYQHFIQNPSKLAYLPTNAVSPANSSKMEHHILTFHRLPCRSRQLREPQSTHPYPSPRAAGSNSPTTTGFTTTERLRRNRNAKKIKI